MTTTNVVEFAKALADETRQKIMKLCCCEWISVNEIVEQLGGITQPTVSHHLAVLREAGQRGSSARHPGQARPPPPLQPPGACGACHGK